jgi:SAM-dependent methyltransferase
VSDGSDAPRTDDELPATLRERAERMRDRGGFVPGGVGVWESVGRMQFATLIANGLRPDSKLLDVGCGSLRAGYWLMHFLDPGCYFGINPRFDEVRQGLDFIVEPEVVARAQPRFSDNGDFDLGVFDTSFDFVLACSVWSHTSKAQIEAMLDSFVRIARPETVLLASYVPASPLPKPLRRVVHGSVRVVPGLAGRVRDWRGHILGRDDYQGDEWAGAVISHDRGWLREQCTRRGLRFSETKSVIGARNQIWAKVQLA